MLKILAAFHLDQPDSLKRAIAAGLGALFVTFVNPFLVSKGFPPVSTEVLVSVAGLVAAFVIQSAAKSIAAAKVAGDAEAAKVTTAVIADAIIGAQLAQPPKAP